MRVDDVVASIQFTSMLDVDVDLWDSQDLAAKWDRAKSQPLSGHGHRITAIYFRQREYSRMSAI